MFPSHKTIFVVCTIKRNFKIHIYTDTHTHILVLIVRAMNTLSITIVKCIYVTCIEFAEILDISVHKYLISFNLLYIFHRILFLYTFR
jgi:hypothetical protein